MNNPSDKPQDDSSLTLSSADPAASNAAESPQDAVSAQEGTAPVPDGPPEDAAPSDTDAPGSVHTLGAAVSAAKRDGSSAIIVDPEGTASFKVPPATEIESPSAPKLEKGPAPGGASPQAASAGSSAPWWKDGNKEAKSDAARPANNGGKAAASSSPKGAAGKKLPPPPQRPAPQPAFAKTHPLLTAEQTMPPSVCSRLYTALALSPLLTLSILLVIQTIFTLNVRELWFSDEVRYAAIFQNLLEQGQGIIPQLNGIDYTDKPPLYFWFLRGMHDLVRTDGPMLHFAAAALSALLYLWAALGLGRMVGRLDGRSNLAAGILLLSTGYVMGVIHYARMDLLFSALVIASLIFLYRAQVSPRGSLFGMALAFALAGAATLVKGPMGLAIPLCSVILFAVWRGTPDQLRGVLISLAALVFGLAPCLYGLPLLQSFDLLPGADALPMLWGFGLLALPALLLLALMAFAPKLRVCAALSLLLMIAAFVVTGGTPYFSWPALYAVPCLLAALPVLWQITPQRLFRTDFYIGLVIGLLVICAWPALIYLETGTLDLIVNVLLKEQVLQPAMDALRLQDGWLSFLARLPFMLLPWIVLVIFLPWRGLFGKSMREGLAASRRPEKEGLAFLWSVVLASLLLVCLQSGTSLIAFLPALPALAILGGRAVMGISAARASGLRFAMAVFLLLSGVLTIILGLMYFDLLPIPLPPCLPEWKIASHGGFFVVGAILLVAGALVWFGLGSSRPEGVLLVLALTAAGLGYPLGGLVAPHFDPVLSPKNQALLMRAYINDGYTAASYNVRSGAYTYYTRKNIKELTSLEEAAALASGGKVVLALPLSDAESWEGKPEGLTQVQRQWMAEREYVLLAAPAVEGLSPAPAPYKPAPDVIDEFIKLVGIDQLIKELFPPKPAEPKPVPQPKAPAPAPVQAPAPEPATPEAPTPASTPDEAAPAKEAPVTSPPPDGGQAVPAQESPTQTQEPASAPEPEKAAPESTAPPQEETAPAAPSAPVEPSAPGHEPVPFEETAAQGEPETSPASEDDSAIPNGPEHRPEQSPEAAPAAETATQDDGAETPAEAAPVPPQEMETPASDQK